MITDEQFGALTRIVRDAKTYYKKTNEEAGLPIIMGNDVELAESFLKSEENRKDRIDSSWWIDDVKSLDESLTDEQCREILQAVNNNHDATVGINWDVLQAEIDSYKEENNLN